MTRVACIDIGTVTARLAVADVEGGRVARLIKHSEICNLGEGVDATGRLRDDAIGRVFSCVRGYVALAVEAGAPAACCTLTSAARDAENSDEMVSALESLGLSPLVIPGRIEGSLTSPTTAGAPPSSRSGRWGRTGRSTSPMSARSTWAAVG